MGENFRRNPDSDGANSLLNYGYTIFRAMAARALVGTGLHPALGLFIKINTTAFAWLMMLWSHSVPGWIGRFIN
jgi:CRISPR-associated protein Cas1